MHLLAIVGFDFDPGDELAGSRASLEGYAGDRRCLGFQYRSDVLNLEKWRFKLVPIIEIQDW